MPLKKSSLHGQNQTCIFGFSSSMPSPLLRVICMIQVLTLKIGISETKHRTIKPCISCTKQHNIWNCFYPFHAFDFPPVYIIKVQLFKLSQADAVGNSWCQCTNCLFSVRCIFWCAICLQLCSSVCYHLLELFLGTTFLLVMNTTVSVGSLMFGKLPFVRLTSYHL